MEYQAHIYNAIAVMMLCLVYIVVFRGFVFVPAYWFGKLVAHIYKKKNHAYSRSEFTAAMSRADALIFVLNFVGFTIVAYYYYSWLEPLFLFWHSPLLLALFGAIIASFSRQTIDGHPIARGVSLFFVGASWTIALTCALAKFIPEHFNTNTARLSAIIAATILLVITGFQLRSVSRNMYQFQVLDERHDELARQLNRMKKLYILLPDVEKEPSIQEAIENVASSYQKALSALRANKLEEAEKVILQAEAEVEGLNRAALDRIRLSLKDELRTKLSQWTADFAAMRIEFEAAGIQGSDFNALQSRLTALSKQVDDLVPDPEKLLLQIEPFENVYKEIVTVRTALRLKRNVGASLDNLRDELRNTERQMAVFNALGLSTTIAQQLRVKLSALIEEFGLQSVTSAESLVEKYSDLRKAASEHRASLNKIESEMRRFFICKDAEKFDAKVFAPAFLTTTETAAGVVMVQYDGAHIVSPLDCELDGTLLELQASRSFQVRQVGAEPFTVAPYLLVGKRGGSARLNVKLHKKPPASMQAGEQNLAPSEMQEVPFDIRVVASTFETARDVFVFATPVGGVAVLTLWIWLGDLSKATPFGAAAGAVVGFVIFAIQRLRQGGRFGKAARSA